MLRVGAWHPDGYFASPLSCHGDTRDISVTSEGYLTVDRPLRLLLIRNLRRLIGARRAPSLNPLGLSSLVLLKEYLRLLDRRGFGRRNRALRAPAGGRESALLVSCCSMVDTAWGVLACRSSTARALAGVFFRLGPVLSTVAGSSYDWRLLRAP